MLSTIQVPDVSAYDMACSSDTGSMGMSAGEFVEVSRGMSVGNWQCWSF